MGRVVFIGAGPGAADLLTVRGAQRLAQADVVLFDALTDPALRQYAPQARWVDVGKRDSCKAVSRPTLSVSGTITTISRRHCPCYLCCRPGVRRRQRFSRSMLLKAAASILLLRSLN